MKITLNPAAPFFFILGTSIHLSDEHPVIELDFTNLDKDAQYSLLQGLQNRQIFSDVPIGSLINYEKPTEITPPSAEVQQDKPVENIELIKLLGRSIGTVKKNIGLCNDVRKLRLMLELEKNNRNRNPIVSALQSQITALSAQVMKNIETNINDNIPTVLSNDKLADLLDVIETDDKVISVVIPPK